MKWLAALALLAASSAGAQEPAWLLVAPQRVLAGETFELIAVAPAGETPPDELTVRVQMDLVEVLVTARAQAQPQGARRRYSATMPSRTGGPATLSIAERDSNAVAIVSFLPKARVAQRRITSGPSSARTSFASATWLTEKAC